MGVDTRKPVLPAPTDSSAVESNAGSVTPTELATDISRMTDKTSHTVPDDGRPITINTGKKRSGGKLSKSHHHSQTSLLIEYFEGGKGQKVTSRPSVRVKVRPSATRKAGDKREGEVVVTEAKSSRKPSYTRRISLGTESPKQIVDEGSVSSFSSLSEESRGAHRLAPVEVEVLPEEGSELSGTSVSKTARFIVPPSDISSMPPDSMLEGNPPPVTSQPDRSRSMSREEVTENSTVTSPARRRSRSLSREKMTQKVLEKLANRPREVNNGSRSRHTEKTKSRSASKEVSEAEAHSAGRLSSPRKDNASVTTGIESSVASNSAVSAKRKSGDQASFISGTSKSSMTPDLLAKFEDVIRRVILPELDVIKKSNTVASNRSKFEKLINQSDVSESSAPNEGIRRRVSKHGSAPDMRTRTSPDKESSGSRRRRRRRREREFDSPSERSSDRRRESGDSLSIEEDRSHRRKSKDKSLRNAAAGALVGGALTAAALQHHDSRSSLERREKRKESKSRSRSASVAETEEIFEKHGVPPMPMRSDIDTELTRSSLLSEQTVTSPTREGLRQVPRGSPREVGSPDSNKAVSSALRTPSKAPVDLRRGLGTYHGNLSNRDLSSYQQQVHEPSDDEDSKTEETAPANAAIVTGSLTTNHLLADEERQRRYENNLHHQHPIRRGLSPIQSVASYNTSEPNRNSIMLARSSNSLASLNKEHQFKEELSIESLSSAPSTNRARSKRPKGINLETGSVILGQHENPSQDDQSQDGSRDIDTDAFFDEQHSENERYRQSYGSEPAGDYRRLTTLTDDSLDTSYRENMTAGHQVTRGYGANPEYVHTAFGVESAVASLYDPSLGSAQSTPSSAHSQADSIERQKRANKQARSGDMQVQDMGSPLKHEYAQSFQHRTGANSPPQSVALSEDEPQMGISGIPVANDPMPEIGVGLDSPQSEITTNPSVIHGPIGGSTHENRDHWPYGATPERSRNGLISPAGENHGLGMNEAVLGAGAADVGLGALGAGYDAQAKAMPASLNLHYTDYDQNRDSYMTGPTALTPPKDEGYISAANPGTHSPDPKAREIALENALGGRFASPAFTDDPFLAPHSGHLNAGDKGIEGIQSKDIVALMDHLTKRDAQRNARDTEILVTLVRSAAEMRNSFEDMKRFIAEQDDLIMDTAEAQHQKTVQKVINGPRPQPLATAHLTMRTNSEEDEETPAKRGNVFKRALRGLSTKNTAELQNIEAMLMRLLGEVEGLRAIQEDRPVDRRAQTNSFHSADNAREATDPGYEPEGQAGTSSTGDRSGYFSNNSSRQANHRGAAAGHRDSTNRVSTVMEGDEDIGIMKSHTPGDTMNPQVGNERTLLTPDRATPIAANTRGTSVPLVTPPRNQIAVNRAVSNENTPQMSIDSKSHRKNKSGSSSFYPKMISRWSKTTASSIVDSFRPNPQNKQRPYSQVSQSGSNLNVGEYEYDPQEDALPSANSYSNGQYGGQDDRPPSPLIPSQVSENPKYHAHRNSQNLQHPQPRQGPTGRFQHHLENEAQTYIPEPFSPTSQVSSIAWNHQQGQPPVQVSSNLNAQQRYSGYSGNDRLSPISDAGYSESSSAMMEMGEEEHARSLRSGASANSVVSTSRHRRHSAPRDDEPLVPQRPPKLPMSPAAARQPNYVDHVSAARAGSPALDKSPVAALRSSPGQARKPSGPRPQTTSGQYSPGYLNSIKRTRFRGSPNQVDSGEDVGEVA